ncbi:HYR-like domain-containing protein [Flavobacterium geliluteum]|uniref:Gliding motility-associated C-terminal domain-containing protein n=1 Tax=Flavobacterium geliluteum TaxID=2816120 RepID=A0A941AWJ4_9FLAO|nr:gliding motility-associated C-terminal domain-containing protein [Flavobacterium geliluteum]MBP4136736.1 gliding motility-associated C-terminal domain-containing protein [Flavobacterium geliluteum]
MKVKITLLILSFLGCVNVNAQSFLISFPNHSVAPTQNPQNLTVCNSSSLLQVRLDVATTATTGANVTLQLPVGIEYVSGSILKSDGSLGLTIAENGGTANAPKFIVGPNALTTGDYIVFTIEKKATCAARTTALSGTIFKDVVTATIAGETPSIGTSPAYQVFYPVFSFTQPATQINAVIGQTYSRSFTITNGGNGCTKEVNFTIDYPSGGIKQTSLTLGGVAITPVSTIGTTSFYKINATELPSGDFCFGETLIFTETYVVKTCDAVTNYATGWGCGSAAADWCQTATGSVGITMVSGVSNYDQFTVSKVGYVNDCTPFSFKIVYKNSGTGNPIAAAMYNAAFEIGQGVEDGSQLQAMNFQSLNLNAAVLNGNSVPHTGGTGTSIYRMNLKDLFTSDPDGVGVGIDDLDGDGFYDDLPAGASITFDIAALVNCNATCNISRSLYYGFCGTILYNTICGSTVVTSNFIRDSHYEKDRDSALSTFFGENLQTADNSYAPSNVYCGVPFRMRFSVNWYSMDPINYNANQKWVYKITLPAGVRVSGTGNPQWNNGKDINSTAFLTPTVTQMGNVVTVVSPDVLPGMVYIDLIVDCNNSCGSSLIIPYHFEYVNDTTVACNCNSAVFCDSYTVKNVVCPDSCTVGGANIKSIKVERADNSLGWTDNTLSTHQVRSAISTYDLSKALYLDQIDITATGVQNGIAATNLFLYTAINKYGGNGDKLTPLSIDVIIKRAGVTVATGTSSVFTTIGTTTTGVLPLYGIQAIRWNLTATLPQGGLLAGDTYETVAHYTVSTNALPSNDVQTGNAIYFYNLDTNNNEISCGSRVPELYLVGTIFNLNPYSQNVTNACGIASSQSTIYRQYAPSGNFYKNEIRPGLIITAYTVTLPAGYTMVGFRNAQDGSPYLTPTSVTGNQYRYELPVVVNDLRPSFNYQSYYADMSPTCATASSENYTIAAEFQDFNYHYKDLSSSNPDAKSETFTVTVPYNTATKPAVTFTNQTGTLQVSKPTESFTVRLANMGTTTAPYTWMSIPNVSGVTITQVVDLTTNTALTPINYSGGTWYKLSTAGLATAATNNYRIDFNYTTCVPTTINVDAGWNCTSFPTDPTEYTCDRNTIALPFIPQTAEIQIINIQQPTTPINLCTSIPFEYRMNSAGAGNTVNNKFVIDLPVGMSYESGSIQAEYPAGSGNWKPVVFKTAGTRTTVDLSSYPDYPAEGLPGTLNDGGNSNLRLIGMRFSLNTNCDFVAGSNINIFANANGSCGVPYTDDGVGSASLPINAIGVVPDYLVVSNLALASGSFNNCSSPLVFNATHTIVSSMATGSTGSARIILPPGYGYVTGSYVCNTSSHCATLKGVFINVAGQSYIDLAIPAGMTSGNTFNYSFAIEKIGSVACSNYRVLLQTIDKVADVGCSSSPGGVCSNIAIQTGSASYEYTISNPTFAITSFKGTYNADNYSGSITINNTSTNNQTNDIPLKIGFYCADVSGNPTGSLLATYTMTNSIATGATVTENYTFSVASACGHGKIIAVISTDNNCICETVSKTSDPLPIATNDSYCYEQGAISTTLNVVSNDTTGKSIIPSTVNLVVPPDATGIVMDSDGDSISMTIDSEGTWSVNETSGEITFTPLSNTILNPTAIQYNARDSAGNVSNNATVVAKAALKQVGSIASSCNANGSGYTLNLAVSGTAPYLVTGTGAPGTWSGNNWTSSTITAGTNYNVSIQDANACNSVVVSGTVPVCCTFKVTNPTFASTTISCYEQLPAAKSLTKLEFEALGNADGVIGNSSCGVIVITASNAPNPGCDGNVIRTYTVTEYADTNNNKVRDADEDMILNTVDFIQTFTIQSSDFVLPPHQSATVECASDIVAPTVPMVKDYCGNVLTPSMPIVSATPSCEGEVTYTYTFTDCSGHTRNWVYTYTIDDTVAPTGTAPADLAVQCIAEIPTADVNLITDVADNCNGGVTVTVSDSNNGGSGGINDPYIIKRTYTLKDCSGLVTNLIQTITVKNTGTTTIPVLADVLLEGCSGTPVAPIINKGCTGTITGTTTTVFPIRQEGTTVVTWVFDDGDGNVITANQNVMINNSITAPISGGDQIECALKDIQTLTAAAIVPVGKQIVWYDSAVAGSIVASPILNSVGSVTYYAETVDVASGCNSLVRTPITLTLNNCSIGLIKKVVFDDNNKDGYAQVGETVSYLFEITNFGDVPLTNVSVTDSKDGLILTGDPINLGVAETNTTEFKGIYKLTQADINLGKVINQATVKGTTPFNTMVTDISDDSSLSEDKPTVLDITKCVIKVSNAISPNEDGLNDAFYIGGLECYPDNTVEIYNRWGVLVFERDRYNNVDRVFKGISEGRATISQSSGLPAGTYFYIIKYKDVNNGATQEKSGYLYLTR